MSRMLEQREWSSWICDELSAVLDVLKVQYGSRVSGVHLDMKAAMADVYLDREIPADAIPALTERFSSEPRLRFTQGAAVCLEHYCSIELFPRAEEPPASFRESLRRFFARAFKGR